MTYEEIIAHFINDGDRIAATEALLELEYELDEIDAILDNAEANGTEDAWV